MCSLARVCLVALIDRDVFVNAINIAWSKVQILLTFLGPSDLVTCIQERLDNYSYVTYKILVFDKYEDNVAKDHERMWRASKSFSDHGLSIASHLDWCNYEKQFQ